MRTANGSAAHFGASIVLVLHGDEIAFFAISNFDKYKDLVTRAQSLTVGGTIDIRMCEVAARGHGLAPADIQCFVKLVPMADAELARLQQEESYVYTCTSAPGWLRALAGIALMLLWVGVVQAERVDTPYGPSSLPLELQQIPGAPVYYLIGRSGVPDAENEGHNRACPRNWQAPGHV